MKEQHYNNHVRYYPLHHFVFYPAITIGFGLAVWQIFRDSANSLLWLAIAVLILIIASLSLLLRQHYALGNQNRIIRLELRLRYFILTGKRLETLEPKFSNGQLYALRFASDEELVALIDKAIKENLSADKIKQSITHWTADHMRL